MTSKGPSRDKPAVKQAVMLMAGSGSRLRVANANLLKPLVPIHGKPLVSFTLDLLAQRGIERVFAVVGFESESLIAGLRPVVPPRLEVQFIHNPDWRKQNGVSVLAAGSYLKEPFLLAMSDHLFQPAMIDHLLKEADLTKTNLAIDRKLDSIFDLSDALKLQTKGDRVIAIGKDLSQFDAIDTGLFLCSPDIFQSLRQAMRDGDCSLADGIRVMSATGNFHLVDIGAMWWQDVDTPEMLAEAESKLGSGEHWPGLAGGSQGTAS